MRWFEPCRFCGEGRPVAMRDPAGGHLRLVCADGEARSPNGGDTDADGFGAVFEVGEASEPEPPAHGGPAKDRVGAASTRTATADGRSRGRASAAAPPALRPRPRREGAARSLRPERPGAGAGSTSAVDALVASLGRLASRPRPAEWYDACRSCPRGRLVAARDDRSGRLVLGCEACVSGCASPGDAADGFGALVAFADALGVQATQRLERA